MAEIATRFILQLRKIGLGDVLDIKVAGETDSNPGSLLKPKAV